MQIIEETLDFRIDDSVVVAIGKFDGIHKGHRDVFKQMNRYSEKGLKTCVVTFSVQPDVILKSMNDRFVLTTSREKRLIFADMGIDYYVELPFGPELMKMPAKKFLDEILLDRLNAKVIVGGSDCKFGYKGQGDLTFLKGEAESGAFEVCAIEKQMYKGEEISSSRIRQAVEAGEIEEASCMLMEPYSFLAESCQINNNITYVTTSPNKLLPPAGTYRTRIPGGLEEAKLVIHDDRQMEIITADGQTLADCTNNNDWYSII